MVNNINLSSYVGSLPASENAGRKIMGGPLYERNQVLSVLSQGVSVISPWTRKCISDLKKYSMDHADVLELLKCALTTGIFKGSEWCVAKPGIPHWLGAGCTGKPYPPPFRLPVEAQLVYCPQPGCRGERRGREVQGDDCGHGTLVSESGFPQ